MWLYETREMTHDQLTVCYCQISITIVSHIYHKIRYSILIRYYR